MKKIMIGMIIILLVLVIFASFILFQAPNHNFQSKPCIWLYKTQEDYSMLRMGFLYLNINTNRTIVSVTDNEAHARPEVDDGYLVGMGTCDPEAARAVVFFKEDFNYQQPINDYIIMTPLSELWICAESSQTPYVALSLTDEVKSSYNTIINKGQLSSFCVPVDVSKTILPESGIDDNV